MGGFMQTGLSETHRFWPISKKTWYILGEIETILQIASDLAKFEIT